MRRASTLAFHVVLSVFSALALAPSALAGTKVVASVDKLAITGDDGPNDVRIDYSDGSDTWVLTIGGGIDSWEGCDQVSAISLICPYTGVIDATASSGGTEGMGAGNDTFTVGYGPDDVPADFPDFGYAVRVDLGPGDDFFGGSEANEIALGQGGDDVLDATEGHDWLAGGELLPADHAASPSPGFDRVFGGPGWDVVYDGDLTPNRGPDVLDGGGGCTQASHPSCLVIPRVEGTGDVDIVYYYFRTGDITLDLASVGASQGESGEGDTARGFERAWTGAGADTVTGNTAVNWILTSGGDDTVDVSGDPGHTDRVDCGAGLDRVTVDPEDQWLVVDMDGDGKWCVPSVPIGPPPPIRQPPPPPPPAVPPSTVDRGIGDALLGAVARAGVSLQRCGTTGLLRKSGCRDTFAAPGPGLVTYRVTTPAARGRQATVIATGRRAIPAAGRYAVRLKATRKGRKTLRKARKLRVTLEVGFTDARGNLTKRSKKVVLRRKRP